MLVHGLRIFQHGDPFVNTCAMSSHKTHTPYNNLIDDGGPGDGTMSLDNFIGGWVHSGYFGTVIIYLKPKATLHV